MKRLLHIFAVISITLILGCAESKPDPRADFYTILKPYIENYYAENGEGVTIDSINILIIDTLTAKKDSIITFQVLDELKGGLSQEMDLTKELLDLSMNQVRLTRSIGDEDLFNVEKSKLQKTSDEYFEMVGSYQGILTRLLRIDSLVKMNEIDSITPTGYQVTLNIKATGKNNTIQDVDSANFVLSLDKRIRDRIKINERLLRGEKPY